MTMTPPELPTVAIISCLGLTLAGLMVVSTSLRRLKAEFARQVEGLIERVVALESREADALRARPVVSRRIDPPARVLIAGPTLITVPNLASASSPSSRDSSEMGRRFAAVWEMADTGASGESIALATGQPIGQVELVLGLRRQLASSETGSQRPT